MKQKSKIFNGLRQKVNQDLYFDITFIKIFVECLILFVGMLLCAFYSFFVYIELGLFLIFILLNINTKKIIYFCIFLMPFTLFFSVDNLYFKDSSRFVYILVLLIYLFQYSKDIIRKEIKINFKTLIPFIFIFLYMTQPWQLNMFVRNIELPICLILLYLINIYKNEFNAKDMIYIFGFAILCSCFIGEFQPYSSRMMELLPYYHTESGMVRFHGCTTTNILATITSICLSLIFFLQLNNEISVLCPIFIVPLEFVLMKTYSKVGFLTFLISFCIYVILYFKRNRRFDIGYCLTIVSVFFGLIYNCDMIEEILNRIFQYENTNVVLSLGIIAILSVPIIRQIRNNNISNEIINKMTTGRFEIWIHYLQNITSSPLTFIFGNGAYLVNLTWGNYLEEGITPHNMYLSYINQYGVLFVLLVFIFLYLLVFKDKRNINLYSFCPCFTFAMCMISEDFLYYELFILILLTAFTTHYKNESNKQIECC